MSEFCALCAVQHLGNKPHENDFYGCVVESRIHDESVLVLPNGTTVAGGLCEGCGATAFDNEGYPWFTCTCGKPVRGDQKCCPTDRETAPKEFTKPIDTELAICNCCGYTDVHHMDEVLGAPCPNCGTIYEV